MPEIRHKTRQWLVYTGKGRPLEIREEKPRRLDSTQAAALGRARQVCEAVWLDGLPVKKALAEIRGIGLPPVGLQQLAQLLPVSRDFNGTVPQLRAGLLAMARRP